MQLRQFVPVIVLFLFPTTFALAQAPSQPTAQTTPSQTTSIGTQLQPALSDVNNTVGSLNIGRWKTSGEIRNQTQQNVLSIQKDIDSTLPGLIGQADAASGSVPPAFAVYRNLDALYDVLLRVVQTANIAAPGSEQAALQSALSHLESTRTSLAQTISGNSQSQEAELVHLRTALKAATAAPPPPPKSMVVNDGPSTSTAAKRKKKKPASTTAPASTSTTPATAPHP